MLRPSSSFNKSVIAIAVIASEAKQSDAKHRSEQSRGIPRLTRYDLLERIRLLRRFSFRSDLDLWKVIVNYFRDRILEKVSLVVSVTPILEEKQLFGAMANFQKMQDFEDSAQQLESYRRLNVQLEAIFKSSSDGIWLCDGNGKIININGASEKINAIKAKDVVGKNVRELKNITKMAVMMSETDALDDYILRNLRTSVLGQGDYGQKPGGQTSLIEETSAFEKRLLQNAMTNFKTTREMAGFLEINQSTVVRKMKKHDLAW